MSVGQRARETVFSVRGRDEEAPTAPQAVARDERPKTVNYFHGAIRRSYDEREAHDLRRLGRRRRRRRRRHANRAATYIRSRAPGRNHHIHTGDGRLRT